MDDGMWYMMGMELFVYLFYTFSLLVVVLTITIAVKAGIAIYNNTIGKRFQ